MRNFQQAPETLFTSVTGLLDPEGESSIRTTIFKILLIHQAVLNSKQLVKEQIDLFTCAVHPYSFIITQLEPITTLYLELGPCEHASGFSVGVWKVLQYILYSTRCIHNPGVFICTKEPPPSWQWFELHSLLMPARQWSCRESADSWCLQSSAIADLTGLKFQRAHQSLSYFQTLPFHTAFCFFSAVFQCCLLVTIFLPKPTNTNRTQIEKLTKEGPLCHTSFPQLHT